MNSTLRGVLARGFLRLGQLTARHTRNRRLINSAVHSTRRITKSRCLHCYALRYNANCIIVPKNRDFGPLSLAQASRYRSSGATAAATEATRQASFAPSRAVDSAALRAVLAFDERVTPLIDAPSGSGSDAEVSSPATRLLSRVLVASRPVEEALNAWRTLGPQGFRLTDAALASFAVRVHSRGHLRNLKDAPLLLDHTEALLSAVTAELTRLDRRHARRLAMLRDERGGLTPYPLPGPAVIRRAAEQAEHLLRAAALATRGLDASPSVGVQDARMYKHCNDLAVGAARSLRNAAVLPSVCAWLSVLEAACQDVPAERLGGSAGGSDGGSTKGPMGALARMAGDDPAWAARVLLPVLDAIRAVDSATTRLAEALQCLVEADMHSHALLKEVQGLCLEPRHRAALPSELAVAVSGCPDPVLAAAASKKRPGGGAGDTHGRKYFSPAVTQRARVSIEATLGAVGVPDGGRVAGAQGRMDDVLAEAAAGAEGELRALHLSLDSPLARPGATSAAVALPLSSISSLCKSFSLARWMGDDEGRLWTALGRAAGVAASASGVPRVRQLDPAEVVSIVAAGMDSLRGGNGGDADAGDNAGPTLPASFLEGAELLPPGANLGEMREAGADGLALDSDAAWDEPLEGSSAIPTAPEGHLGEVLFEGEWEADTGGTGAFGQGKKNAERLGKLLTAGTGSLLDEAQFDSSDAVDLASIGRDALEARLLKVYWANVAGRRDGGGVDGAAGRGRVSRSLLRAGSRGAGIRFAGSRPVSTPTPGASTMAGGGSLGTLQKEWVQADAEAKVASLAQAHWAHLALTRLSPLAPHAALLDTALPATACKSAFLARHAKVRASKDEYVLIRDAAEDSGLVTPTGNLATRKEGLLLSAAWPEARAGVDLLRQEELSRPAQSGANLDWSAAAAEGRRVTTQEHADWERRNAQLVRALGPDRIKEAGAAGLAGAAGRALAEAYAQARLAAGASMPSIEANKAGRRGSGKARRDGRRRPESDPIPGVPKRIRDILTLPIRSMQGHRGSSDGGPFAGRMGRGGALLQTPEGSLLRTLAAGGDGDMIEGINRSQPLRGRNRRGLGSKRIEGRVDSSAVVASRTDTPTRAGAAELAKSLGEAQHSAVLHGSFVVRKPRQATEAGHSSVSIRDGTFVPVPRVAESARMLGSEIRRARERVVQASKELKYLLGPSAARHAEDIGLLPVSAPVRGKVEFLPKGRYLKPGTKRGAPVLLPGKGVQLGLPPSSGSSGSDTRVAAARSAGAIVEGTAGVLLSMPVPGGPVDRTIEKEAERYAAHVREVERGGAGLVQVGGGGSGLMVGTPEHLEEHRQIWQLDQDPDGEYDEEKVLPARDSKLLEAPSIPLEEQSLDTADIFMLPPDNSRQLQLEGDPSAALQIGAPHEYSPPQGISEDGELARSRRPSSGNGGYQGNGDRDRGKERPTDAAIQVHRRLATGALGPDGPRADEFSGELLVPRLPLATVQAAKAPAMVVAEAQEALATALADEHRSIEALKADAKSTGLPPALLRIWTRDGGMSKEEEAYLKQKDRFPLPAARLRHDVLRASGWDLVSVPFDHWHGVPEDRRRRLLAMMLPRTVRRQREPDEVSVATGAGGRGGGNAVEAGRT